MGSRTLPRSIVHLGNVAAPRVTPRDPVATLPNGVRAPYPHVVELAGVGHYPQLEAPEAVLAAVLDGFAAAARPAS